MTSVPTQTKNLPHGAIPLLGFGTWQITGPAATDATRWALAAGYRHLDTATVYGNETEVGAGFAASGLARDDVFLTSKIPPDRAGQARTVLQASLAALGVEALDLWLIHWPDGDAGVGLWRELLDAREAGLVRDIGVSNYSLDHLDELHAATGVMPALNQIPWSPLRHDVELLRGHRERGVVLEGYSALRGGTLDDPVIRAVADETGRTTAQVIIRWHLQHGVVVIPKSQVAERIEANGDVDGFTLTHEQMGRLDALGAPPAS